MGSYIGIQLDPCFYIVWTFYVFTNKDMAIYFISSKILLEAARLQTNAFHCLYVSSISVYHMYSLANQVRACDVHHLCVACVHRQSCGCQNCMLQCLCMPLFLSFTYSKHADTHMYWHTCVKFLIELYCI